MPTVGDPRVVTRTVPVAVFQVMRAKLPDLREFDDQHDARMTTMPQCRNCNHDVRPTIGQCPNCGAPMNMPNADLEQQVRALLDDGQKIAAVKLYRDQTGASLAEAKQAVESIQADPGPPSAQAETGGDLEAELLRLLGRGDKLDAVKLYKDRMGVTLIEAKQAVESLAARHGLVTQRAGCLGVVLAVVLAAVTLGMRSF